MEIWTGVGEIAADKKWNCETMATKKADPDSVKGVPGVKSWGFGEHSLWGTRGRATDMGAWTDKVFFSAGVATGARAIGKDSRLEAAGNGPRQTEMDAASATERARYITTHV